MSILIPGMKMPKYGECIVITSDGVASKYLAGDVAIYYDARPDKASAIELHPHGRMIDADAFAATYIADMPDAIHELKDKRKVPMFVNQIQALLMDIAEAPTIIPAEEE